MNRQQAIKQLTETMQLTTKIIGPLNIGFDTFLQFSQLPEDTKMNMINALIKQFSNEDK